MPTKAKTRAKPARDSHGRFAKRPARRKASARRKSRGGGGRKRKR